MNTEQERAAFEWWASDEGQSPRATERVGGCYKLAQIQSYWMAWQARAALQAENDALQAELVEALEGIAEWTDRWTSPGHPVSNVARAAIEAATRQEKTDD